MLIKNFVPLLKIILYCELRSWNHFSHTVRTSTLFFFLPPNRSLLWNTCMKRVFMLSQELWLDTMVATGTIINLSLLIHTGHARTGMSSKQKVYDQFKHNHCTQIAMNYTNYLHHKHKTWRNRWLTWPTPELHSSQALHMMTILYITIGQWPDLDRVRYQKLQLELKARWPTFEIYPHPSKAWMPQEHS